MNPTTTIQKMVDELLYSHVDETEVYGVQEYPSYAAKYKFLLFLTLSSDEVSLPVKKRLATKYAGLESVARGWALKNFDMAELINFINNHGVSSAESLYANPACDEEVIASAFLVVRVYREIINLFENIPDGWWTEDFSSSLRGAILGNSIAFETEEELRNQLIFFAVRKTNSWAEELPDSWLEEAFVKKTCSIEK